MGDMMVYRVMGLSKLALDWSEMGCIARRSMVPPEVYDYDAIGNDIQDLFPKLPSRETQIYR
jgi:hypothetical protein